jgi:putative beta-lysine N-acetyltransferase
MEKKMDKIELVGKSKIQHGKYNDRVYGMTIHPDDLPAVIDHIEKVADNNDYGKLFIKTPRNIATAFTERGFEKEAHIPLYFKGQEDAVFMVKYRDPDRRNDHRMDHVKKVLDAAKNTTTLTEPPELDKKFRFTLIKPEHAEQMSELYKIVFQTYPFPIHDPEYLIDTMESHVVYCGILYDDRLVALASSEMDTQNQSVEMTDFATLPDYRGSGFATYLLYRMEKEMMKRNMQTAFTIARAMSFGMNITFAKHNYRFGGTLINNTNILDTIESMNIWYKPLTQSS